MTLPADFISRIQALLGTDYPAFEAALQETPPVSIRMNPVKYDKSPEGLPVTWSEHGYYLSQRPTFTFDPLFHAGAYYVQEASSMFLQEAIRTVVKDPVRCLDLCAAPGGKSTHLLSALPERSLLVSNEVIRNRCHILAETLTKWGNPYTIVSQNDPAAFSSLTHFFDVIVADVPCSGEGMFRKDPASREEWSLPHVDMCAARQRRIIYDIWDALAPGGFLIYSTCTYNTEENEENIHQFIQELGAEPVLIPVLPAWGISGPFIYDHPVYRFFPHKTQGEGFFLAVLRKKEGERTVLTYKPESGKKGNRPVSVFPGDISGWLRESDHFHLFTNGERLQAFPKEYLPEYKQLASLLKVVTAGISLGEIKGKDVMPAHPLAMSTFFSPDHFSQVEIGWEDAIRFLRKETFPLDASLPKGYVVLTWQGVPLGFVKHLGNRANNLYPQEWRIRSSYIPEELRMVFCK
ncbi:MAG: RsmB/NOP family class I SAM-dependent RNA methyltransferase [Tannerellaceae bacterium]|nr:RsmB/NOP family class I SAM-dependent RNA methyltransferase [Tannerellaceae bacterium]